MRALRSLLLTSALAVLSVSTAAPPARAEIARSQSFLDEVDHAIDRGAVWLLEQQRDDGSWPSSYSTSYPAAMTALCYHTLSVCGIPANDPQMERAYAKLRSEYETARRRRMLRTYSAAVMMMAVADHARSAAGDASGGSASDRAWMEDLVRFLIGAQNDNGAWHYGDAMRYRRRRNPNAWDHSNTQYALLGLKAARRMGVAVDPIVFRRTLDHLLGTQQTDGKRVQRYRGGRKSRTSSRAFDRARGWSYHEPEGATIYGSMTAGSLGALVICRSELIGTPGYPAGKDAEAEQAIWDGIAWLGREFEVRENPGFGGWHYYYLYGLERAGVLAGVDHMGEHDWYGLGAKYLLSAQEKPGSWADAGGRELATCFALLFLKRGTLPVRQGAVTPSIEENPELFAGAELLAGKDFEDFVDLVVGRFARTSSGATKTALARGMIDLGQRIVPSLLNRMGAGRPGIRSAAHDLLVRATGLTLPFDPAADPAARAEALLPFEVWYMEHKTRLRKDRKTGLLAPQPE